jgi:hypothetical protein
VEKLGDKQPAGVQVTIPEIFGEGDVVKETECGANS